ncbi:MAG: Chaperone protein dnaJ [Deltaproteobacteria bacterium]|nr:Chaperone protein dnaJ [Deltaproteobacteria bacterium]
MKDYYKILGLFNDASQEEIHGRWVELTRQHSPDRLKCEGGEQIVEINEAYQVLKDPVTRFKYDLERDLKKSILKKKEYEKRKRAIRLSRILPVAAASVFILGAAFIYFFSELQGPTRRVERRPMVPPQTEAPGPIEKETQPVPPAEPADPQIAQAVPKPSLPVPPSAPPKESPPKAPPPPVSKPRAPARIEKEAAKEPAKKPPVALAPALRGDAAKYAAPPPAVSRPAQPVRDEEKSVGDPAKKEEIPPAGRQVAEERAENVPPRPAPAAPPRIPPAPLAPPKAVEPAKPVGETLKEPGKEVIPEKSTAAPRETAKVEVFGPAASESPPKVAPPTPLPAPKPEEPVKTAKDVPRETAPPPIAREEEVMEFLTRYANQYVGRNLEGFLSLFSPQAVQNQRFDYKAIKNMYAKFFEESQRLKYRIKPETIDLSPSEAKVRGTYQIEQETKGGQLKEWKGNIQWTLVKEQGTLKVRVIQYQHSQKP